jgi:putative protease
MEEDLRKIGEVFKYFSKPMVAGIKITDSSLSVGDKIKIKGATTDIEMTVDSMQIDMNPVEEVKAGDEVGIKVPDKVRPNDIVYKME